MNRVSVVACLAAMALLGGLVFTQETAIDKRIKEKPAAPAAAAKPAAPAATTTKPAVHKVEKKPFHVELAVSGILDAAEAVEIRYRPQLSMMPSPNQGPLTIRTIVEHGTAIKQGEQLVAFDTRKIDEVIADAETEKKMLEASLKVAQEELPLYEKAAPMDLALAENAKQRADEAFKYFVEVGRPEAEKRTNYSVKSSKFMLEFYQEELQQLQKMYKANDLTEDTEKIVLRRQQYYVEMAQFMYQMALVQHDYMMKFTLPHQHKDLADSQERQTLLLEKLRATQEPMLRQKQLALARMRFEMGKNAKRLERLYADRETMSIRAPVDGIVYHGKLHKGHWTMSDFLASKLVPDGTVLPEEVFLTVVKPRPLVVHLSVAEKDVHWLQPGLAGKAKVPYRPDRKLGARVTRIAPLPASPEKYDVSVALDLGPEDTCLMPGMACSVKFVPYTKPNAIAVPTACIHDEDDRSVVYVLSKQGKHHQREVKLGPSDGDRTEIVSGLHEGEEVLLQRPSAHEGGTKSAPMKEKKGATP